MSEIIRCENLQKTFVTDRGTTEVIKDISLSVNKNEFVVIFGPGQCGKSTLVNLLSGLETPTAGSITVNGNPVTAPGPDRGMVYQSISLFPWLTVMGNVELGPKMRGIDKKERRERARYFIKLVGLEGFENAYPNRLSGGMKQRVGIARAYCNDPDVLFMDEPFGALDAQTRYLMQDEIVRIWEKEKKTVVFVTNNIEEALYLGDRIIMLTNCPATVKKEYSIDFPRPRSMTDHAFLEKREEITAFMDKTL